LIYFIGGDVETELLRLRKSFGADEGVSLSPLQLDEYQRLASQTDKSASPGAGGIQLLMLGLFGEVGGLLSELKKKQRDQSAYFAYKATSLEELGDVLWYFSNIALKSKISLSAIANSAVHVSDMPEVRRHEGVATFRDIQPQLRMFQGPIGGSTVQSRLMDLGAQTVALLNATPGNSTEVFEALVRIFRSLINAAEDAETSIEEAALSNLAKIVDRWPLKVDWGQLYDDPADTEESFPRILEFKFKEKTVAGKTYVYQQCREINIGDRLTDNSSTEDDYRFHDALHLAFAAILGWSPVLRALLKLKRKSNSSTDEVQDGARAIIAEEGISNWVFSQGLRHDLFETVGSLDFSVLKTIRDMVKGYEVETRPLWMWERAILEGFRVFRELKRHRRGIVTVDLNARTLSFREIPE
jgi:NTP pyrophosphatase (non-canonical NTP hydrolase)